MSPRRDAPIVVGAKTATRWERVTAAWTGSGGERRRRQQRAAPGLQTRAAQMRSGRGRRQRMSWRAWSASTVVGEI
uniref:Uncharacterized protein n=1 Tax=Oryza glumipatula TaxID=40148 RepID=A0A0E0BIY0_9ORYZ